jgi:hypothetical protein
MKLLLTLALVNFCFSRSKVHPLMSHENTQAVIHLNLGNKVSADNTVGNAPDQRMYVNQD